jgi:hypothetical protein
MSLMRAGKQIPPVVEMTRNAEVKRGAPEQQMVTYQEGNRTQGDIECQKCNSTEKCKHPRVHYYM